MSNTRALLNKLDELHAVLAYNRVDIAAITETWVSPSVPDSCTDIAG